MVARDQYGTGELGLHSGECDERSTGVHFGGTGFAVAELIDPDSGDVLPFTDGQQGEVVYTSIRREASPLLRMRSHDLMQVFTEPCGCGRTTLPVPRSSGRSDDMFIVKGVNVFPLAIQTSLHVARAAGHRGVPGRPRPAAADRLPGAAVGRGRRRRTDRTTRRPRRARSSSGCSATLNFTASVTLVGPGSDRGRGQDAPGHPHLSRGGRCSGGRRGRESRRRRAHHSQPPREAERHQRRDARRALRRDRGDRRDRTRSVRPC